MVAAWSVIAVVMKIVLPANAVIQTAERVASAPALTILIAVRVNAVSMATAGCASSVPTPATVLVVPAA